MDISTIVVVVALVSTFLVGVVWLQIESRKNVSKKRRQEGTISESDERQNVVYENS